jgi:hypothetical protein
MPLEPGSLSFLGFQKLGFTIAPGLLLSLGESYPFSGGSLQMLTADSAKRLLGVSGLLPKSDRGAQDLWPTNLRS